MTHTSQDLSCPRRVLGRLAILAVSLSTVVTTLVVAPAAAASPDLPPGWPLPPAVAQRVEVTGHHQLALAAAVPFAEFRATWQRELGLQGWEVVDDVFFAQEPFWGGCVFTIGWGPTIPVWQAIIERAGVRLALYASGEGVSDGETCAGPPAGIEPWSRLSVRPTTDASAEPGATVDGATGRTVTGAGTVEHVWTVTAAGVVRGDPHFGDLATTNLKRPIVGIASTPSGKGYWLASADGGVFTFGDAPFVGSMGGTRLSRPIVGIEATPSGRGYWLVAADGGIFTFGDARFLGSTGAIRLQQPIVRMARTPSGRGYWLVAADGGIFTFGDAKYLGSASGRLGDDRAVDVIATPTGRGYWVASSHGKIISFGDARRAVIDVPTTEHHLEVVALMTMGSSILFAQRGGSVLIAR